MAFPGRAIGERDAQITRCSSDTVGPWPLVFLQFHGDASARICGLATACSSNSRAPSARDTDARQGEWQGKTRAEARYHVSFSASIAASM